MMETENSQDSDPAGCLLRMVLPAGWICLILAGSLLPKGPPTPGGFGFEGMDKLLHFGGYAIFAALADWALVEEPGSARGCIAVIFPFCVGAAIEIVQPLVGRTMSWADAGANTAGLVAGFVLAEMVLRARRTAGSGAAAEDV